ncbi:MAG: SpoIID/LytB domain-containing protein [Thermodesulfovibrionales bacterium]|nr:SpoIID/LytB domain-containing protein [Thermodesulfovibrionales bacterium]
MSKWIVCLTNVLLIVFFFCLNDVVFAETKVRVLIADGKKFKIPAKDEKVERLGNAKGDAYLDGMRYKGNIEVWKGNGGLYLVNELTLEDYIKGVVVGEMGASWEIEALKAQAVAARTYAVFQMNNGIRQKPIRYHLTSSVLHQVFKGGNIPESISKAVDETKGEVILFEGKPIIAYYHSTSGGMTEEASEVFMNGYPYLVPVETSSELSPYHIWERKIPIVEIENATQLKGIRDIQIESYTVSDRVKDIRFILQDKEILFPAKDLRKNLGWDRLPSTLITNITKDGDDYIFEGRGYGHGVGMCQWTALDMAKKGMNYKEILGYFYPNTTIQRYESK